MKETKTRRRKPPRDDSTPWHMIVVYVAVGAGFYAVNSHSPWRFISLIVFVGAVLSIVQKIRFGLSQRSAGRGSGATILLDSPHGTNGVRSDIDYLEVRIPALSREAESARIMRWLKNVGDRVEDGEPLVEIATDTVDTEIQSPGTGTLVSINTFTRQEAVTGTVIALISPQLES